MRNEQYSTFLSMEFFQAHQQVVALRSSAMSSYQLPAARRANVAKANRAIDKIMSDLQVSVDKYYEQDFTKVYKSGFSSKVDDTKNILRTKAQPLPAKNPLSSSERSYLSRQRKAGRAELTEAISQTKARSRAGMVRDLNKSTNFRTVEAGRNMYNLDTYANMAINARANNASNRGALFALDRMGNTKVQVFDGNGCGWNYHDDSEKAEGKVVSIDEGRSHLVSHPYCVRTFMPIVPTGDKGAKSRLNKIVKTAAIATAVGAVGAVGAAAYQNRGPILAQVNRLLLSGTPEWKLFDLQIRAIQRELERISSTAGDNVFDLRTGKPLSSSPIDIASRISADAHNYVQGVDVSMDAHTRQVLGILDDTDRFTSIRKIQEFDKFYEANRKASMSEKLLSDIDEVEKRFRTEIIQQVSNAGFADDFGSGFVNAVVEQAGKTKGKILRGPSDRVFEKIESVLPNNNLTRVTIPRIRGADQGGWMRSLRGRLDMGRWVRATGTQKLNGERVGSLIVNRNGLLRMGMQYGADGVIYPRMSLVPKKMPLRILTRLNRGVDGDITSLSGQLRILIPGPFKPSANFNIDLRSLALEDLWDVRSISLRDLKTVIGDNFKIRSLALESKWRLMGKMDVSNIWRIKYEDAVRLVSMTDNDVITDGSRSITAFRRAKYAEERYFGPDFKNDLGAGIERFRSLSGSQMKQYYLKHLEAAQDIATEVSAYGKTIAKDEFDRQVGIVKKDLANTAEYLGDIAFSIKNFDKQVAKQWIEDISALGMQEGNSAISAAEKARALIKAKFPPMSPSQVPSFASSEFQRLRRMFPSLHSDVIEDTVRTLRAAHKKIFIDRPAEKRRRLIGIIKYEAESPDLLKILDTTTWNDKIRIWGSDLIETANKFKTNLKGAANIQEGIALRLRSSSRAVAEFGRNMSKNDLATIISNHFVNVKKGLVGIRDWDNYRAAGDRTIEAFGDFGKWLADLKDPSKVADELGLPSLKEPVRVGLEDIDYRSVESKSLDALFEDHNIVLGGDGVSLEKGPNLEKVRQILTMYADKFDLKDGLEIKFAEEIEGMPGDWGGYYDPIDNQMFLRSNVLNEIPGTEWDIMKALDYQETKSLMREGDEAIGTLVHEMGHVVDEAKGATERNAGKLLEILHDEFPGMIRSTDALTSDQSKRADDIIERINNRMDLLDDDGIDVTHYINEDKDTFTKAGLEMQELSIVIELNKARLARELSVYGTTNAQEFLAEVFRTVLLSDNPPRFAIRYLRAIQEMETRVR